MALTKDAKLSVFGVSSKKLLADSSVDEFAEAVGSGDGSGVTAAFVTQAVANEASSRSVADSQLSDRIAALGDQIADSLPVEWSDIEGVPSSFEPMPHIHDISDITGSFPVEIWHEAMDTQYQSDVITPVDVETGLQLVTSSELAFHSAYDYSMFSTGMAQMRQMIADLTIRLNAATGKIDEIYDGTPVDITADVNGGGYVVSSPLGGMVSGVGQNILGLSLLGITIAVSVWSISRNGIIADSGSLISINEDNFVPFRVSNGDILTGVSITNATFTPFIPSTIPE